MVDLPRNHDSLDKRCALKQAALQRPSAPPLIVAHKRHSRHPTVEFYEGDQSLEPRQLLPDQLADARVWVLGVGEGDASDGMSLRGNERYEEALEDVVAAEREYVVLERHQCGFLRHLAADAQDAEVDADAWPGINATGIV